MNKITAAEIRNAMKKRWSDPEWALMWEVSESTGAMACRSADAVMMSLWPSRGLEMHGVEIKVSRSDWKREAKDPTKAEAIAKYCDRWWIHTSPGVVDDISDMPPAWGLREFDGKKWKTIKEAEKTEATPVTRQFLASLLRRSDGLMQTFINDALRQGREAAEREAKNLRDNYFKDVERAVERKTAHLAKGADQVQKFNAVFGEGAASSWECQPEMWGKAAKALAQIGSEYAYSGLSERLRKAADEIDALVSISRGEV